MNRKCAIVVLISFTILIGACSKKHHASKTLDTGNVELNKADTLSVKKVVTSKPKYETAKVIVVNDSVARKSVDGRLYYDLLGHRYWKNYKDGKYYLFNQSMYSNNDFKPK
ncbi:MAG: hypothetical protein ABIR81_07855 [Ginsengibacter sp.]